MMLMGMAVSMLNLVMYIPPAPTPSFSIISMLPFPKASSVTILSFPRAPFPSRIGALPKSSSFIFPSISRLITFIIRDTMIITMCVVATISHMIVITPTFGISSSSAPPPSAPMVII